MTTEVTETANLIDESRTIQKGTRFKFTEAYFLGLEEDQSTARAMYGYLRSKGIDKDTLLEVVELTSMTMWTNFNGIYQFKIVETGEIISLYQSGLKEYWCWVVLSDFHEYEIVE